MSIERKEQSTIDALTRVIRTEANKMVRNIRTDKSSDVEIMARVGATFPSLSLSVDQPLQAHVCPLNAFPA